MSLAQILYSEEDYYEKRHITDGIKIGIVSNIDDPEKLGRVKVKLLFRDSSDFETDFSPVITNMSGDKWGTWFFPQIGDLVAVAFLEGEISKPIILGNIWNKENANPPVEISDGKNDIRKIKTRSGHEIIFDDTEDKEDITIITPKNLTIKMNDEKEVITISDKDGKNIVKIDTKNEIIDVNAQKKINLVSQNSKIELDGDGNKVNIESNSSISIKAQQISIEAKNTIDLKASAGMNIKSDGSLNLKGAVAKIN